MPTLFDSHDEFSEWFSKDIESHAQTNTKLNEDQLKRLHMILKPFMLRRVKKHVQKELGDKIEIDLFCDLTYRQRKIYSRLRSEITLMDLLERAAMSEASDSESLMNLVMQFRKVCNHPDLFEPARITSPYSFGYFAETGSFLRERATIDVAYSTTNLIEYRLPRRIWRDDGRLYLTGSQNAKAGFRGRYLDRLLNVWSPDNIQASQHETHSWLRFSDTSVGEASAAFHQDLFTRSVNLAQQQKRMAAFSVAYDEDDENYTPAHALFRIADRHDRTALAASTKEGYLANLLNVSKANWSEHGYGRFEQCAAPKITAPPIDVVCDSAGTRIEREHARFNIGMRRALFGPALAHEAALIESKVSPSFYPHRALLPAPTAERKGFTDVQVPSRLRLVSDSGKLAKLDSLLHKLKEEGHRVLLYFQMTRMIDIMEEYLTYRSYKYLRLDGSTKLEDRRDTVHDFQTKPEIFIFLLSTRAGGLGINLTTADTVIFYDSDWNPTIDSQAMDRAHRLGQTKQVTVYRMITRGTIEERIRKRALQKEEVQKVVMTGGAGVDFNKGKSKEERNREVAMWLVDDEEAGEMERVVKERQEREEKEAKEGGPAKKKPGRKRKAPGDGKGGSLEDLYHEGEGHFDDGSARPSGAATPVDDGTPNAKRGNLGKGRGGGARKAKIVRQRFAMADGE